MPTYIVIHGEEVPVPDDVAAEGGKVIEAWYAEQLAARSADTPRRKKSPPPSAGEG